MPALVLPSTRLHTAFLECRADWGPGVHEDGFGLRPGDDVASAEGFATWVRRCLERTHPPSAPCPAGPHASPRWIVGDGQVLGAIALRHVLDDRLGHVGYGVRPSARGRGLAGWALGEMLAEARALGLNRLLVVCREANIASARTIERHGGVVEDTRDTGSGRLRRYRIDLGPA